MASCLSQLTSYTSPVALRSVFTHHRWMFESETFPLTDVSSLSWQSDSFSLTFLYFPKAHNLILIPGAESSLYNQWILLVLLSKYFLSPPISLRISKSSYFALCHYLSSPLCLSLPTLSTHPTPAPSSCNPSPLNYRGKFMCFYWALKYSIVSLTIWRSHMFLVIQMPIISFLEKLPVPKWSKNRKPCSQAKVSEHSKSFLLSQLIGQGMDLWPLDASSSLLWWGGHTLGKESKAFCRQTKMYVAVKSRELGKRHEVPYRHTESHLSSCLLSSGCCFSWGPSEFLAKAFILQNYTFQSQLDRALFLVNKSE